MHQLSSSVKTSKKVHLFMIVLWGQWSMAIGHLMEKKHMEYNRGGPPPYG